ncbi:CarD family transcriptional regulator [Virgibacillus oceani]
MFNIGDLIIYTTHGLCEIVDICDKNIGNVTRTYYVMHPMEDPKLTISIPKDIGEKNMQPVMEKREAKMILQSFQNIGIPWIEDARERNKKYSNLVKTGERKDISRIANTLMRKKSELRKNKQKMSEQDRKLLESIQHILFQEMAVSMDTSMEEISEEVDSMIKQTG